MKKAPVLFVVLGGLTSLVASAAEWQVRITDSGAVEVLHKQAVLVKSAYLFWGADWKFAAMKSRVEKAGAEGAGLSGEVALLKLKLDAGITNPAPCKLVFAYKLDAAEDMKGIVGGGLEFNLKLDSPSFDKPPGEPVLLEGNKGWKWAVADGQAIAVSFDEPIASVYFERGQKQTIRAMFVGKELPKGAMTIAMTVTLPEGAELVRSASDRYGPVDARTWYPDAMSPDDSPVDLSFLNKDEKPAGKRGFVKAKGDELVFEDGTAARFWGGNIAAYAIFSDKEQIQKQARRIARMGYNLMRIHHHDSMTWVSRTVIDKTKADSQHLDEEVMDRLDWWIKCLKDEGVYVWLDLHVGRQFKEGDNLGDGADEILRRKGEIKGFCHFSPRIQELMRDFNAKYLSHVNSYTKLAYKDEPAIMGLLITNENDLTHHFGNLMLGDKGNPVYNKVFLAKVKEFCAKTGLPEGETGKTWVPGPSKMFLNHQEHLFNQAMLSGLKDLGVKVPVATTNYWGDEGLYSLPALTDSGIIDTHSYGRGEELSDNPRYTANFIPWLAAGQVHGKPLSATEWNVPYPAKDRCTTPLYVAGIACLQGWDAPMIYNYSQRAFGRADRPDTWSTYYDPAISGMMPAAAVLFRQGHVGPARKTYCLKLSREQLYYSHLSPASCAAVRTLAETSKLTIGLPGIKELDWTAESKPDSSVQVVTEPNQDFIPKGQDFVQSDTGELKRDWAKGVQTIDTPRTQAATGWVGAEKINLKDVTFGITTPKAAVCVTSLDGQPIGASRRILITAVARAVENPDRKTPYLSEPVSGAVTIRSQVSGLKLAALGPDGKELPAAAPATSGGAYTINLPVAGGTHWFLLTQ